MRMQTEKKRIKVCGSWGSSTEGSSFEQAPELFGLKAPICKEIQSGGTNCLKPRLNLKEANGKAREMAIA